jgi:hypothetical protein
MSGGARCVSATTVHWKMTSIVIVTTKPNLISTMTRWIGLADEV